MSAVRLEPSPFRLLAGATALALAGQLLLAVPSWAAEPVSLATADLTAAAEASSGAFSVSGPTATDDLTITGDLTLTGRASAGRVVTVAGGTAQAPRVISLRDVSLSVAGQDRAAVQLAPGAHARLILAGASELTGSASYPGLGIPVDAGATISADGAGGTLNVSGTGTAAAIGGDGNAVLSEPAIKPVTIAGLAEASCGALTISGGTVNATVTGANDTGAAIGGGRFGSGCEVTITGGVVNAVATAGAGIGGGTGKDGANGYTKDSPGGAGGNVTISGGTVSATSAGMTITGESSPRFSAAIGGGRGGGGGAEDQGTNGAAGTLSITGGTTKLSPRQSDMAPTPMAGSQLLGLVKVNNVPDVSQVVVTPQDGTAKPFQISANHPSDDSLYLYLPYPKRYSIDVTAGGRTATYAATLAATGGDVNATLPAPEPAKLSVAAPTFEPAQWGYPRPAAKPLVVTNTGGTAARVSGVSVSSAAFTVTKPAVVDVPAGGSAATITVQPAAGLGVGTHEAVVTVLYGDGTSVAVPVSFTVTGSADLRLTAPVFPAVTYSEASPATGQLTITNLGTAPATLTKVVSSNPAVFQVTNSTATLLPKAAVKVSVRPAANLAVGEYRATITAAYAGRTATAQVALTVKPRPVVAVRAAQTTLTLVKGSSLTIPAFGYEAGGKTRQVSWSSSSNAVATVSSKGTIKGVKSGSARITATAGGLRATISVKVLSKKSKTKVKSVSAAVPKTMKRGARAYLSGKFSPTSAPGVKVTYSSSAKSVLVVDSAGALTAVKKGKATITIKAGGKSKKYTVSVT